MERFSHGPDGFWQDPEGLYVEFSDHLADKADDLEKLAGEFERVRRNDGEEWYAAHHTIAARLRRRAVELRNQPADQQQHSTEEGDRWQNLKAALFSDEACRAGAAVLAGEGGVSDGDVVEVRHELQAAWDVATGHAFSLPPDAPSSTEDGGGE